MTFILGGCTNCKNVVATHKYGTSKLCPNCLSKLHPDLAALATPLLTEALSPVNTNQLLHLCQWCKKNLSTHMVFDTRICDTCVPSKKGYTAIESPLQQQRTRKEPQHHVKLKDGTYSLRLPHVTPRGVCTGFNRKLNITFTVTSHIIAPHPYARTIQHYYKLALPLIWPPYSRPWVQ